MTESTQPRIEPARKGRFWPWFLGAFTVAIVSGLVQPSSLGLEPSLATLEERAQSVAHDASVQGVAETLGMAPDEVILRRFPSSEPFGDEERIQGSALSDATWALVPKAESSEGGEDLLILLEFRPSEPWLISLGRGIQRTLSGAELQVVHRRFEMLGSQKHGWLGSRDDGVEGPGANAQQLMPVLLGYVDPRTRALFRNHLLMDSAANPGKP